MFGCRRVSSSLSLSRHPGAVASSRGERGKPSRGTSERGEERELETLWSLSSFKWKQLHRAPPPTLQPFTDPVRWFPSPPSTPPPPTPFLTSPHFHCHCTSHLVLSMVLSAPRPLASERNVAVQLTPQQTLDSFTDET